MPTVCVCVSVFLATSFCLSKRSTSCFHDCCLDDPAVRLSVWQSFKSFRFSALSPTLSLSRSLYRVPMPSLLFSLLIVSFFVSLYLFLSLSLSLALPGSFLCVSFCWMSAIRIEKLRISALLAFCGDVRGLPHASRTWAMVCRPICSGHWHVARPDRNDEKLPLSHQASP